MNFIKTFNDYFILTESVISHIYSVEEVDLTDGIYDGIQGGYNVDIKGTNISFKTNNGIRCSNCPCKVQIENKKAYII